jgi:hypothetical protein
MRRLRACIALAGLGSALPTVAARGNVVINFHDAGQGYSHYGGYNVLYYGQGAAFDPGNNYWNGFGKYGGPGSTDFYGPNNPSSFHGVVPSGNPGQPYAWHNGVSASGPNLFSPSNPGALDAGNANSVGTISPVTLSLSYDADVGTDNGVTQRQPSFILSHAAQVTGGHVGTFALQNVPAGTYNLFLFGSSPVGTGGAAFTVSSGAALNDLASTINPLAVPTGNALNQFALGQTYVEFLGVTPDANGVISGTWAAIDNPISGVSGEGDFNGLQLVSTNSSDVPEPAALGGAVAASAMALLGRRGRKRPRGVDSASP